MAFPPACRALLRARLQPSRAASQLRPRLDYRKWAGAVEAYQANSDRRLAVKANVRRTVELYQRFCELQQERNAARNLRNTLTAAVKVRLRRGGCVCVGGGKVCEGVCLRLCASRQR